MLIRQSEPVAAQRQIPILLVDDGDAKTPEPGIVPSVGELKVIKPSGSIANAAGTWIEVGGAGNGEGHYLYEATIAELSDLGQLIVLIRRTGIYPMSYGAIVVAFDPYNEVRLGLTGLVDSARQGGLVVDDAANTAQTFKTDLVGPDNYCVDQWVRFAGGEIDTVPEIAEITSFVSSTAFVSLNRSLTAEPLAGAAFTLLDR